MPFVPEIPEQLLALAPVPAHLRDQGARAPARSFFRILTYCCRCRGFGVFERRDGGQDEELGGAVERAGLGPLERFEIHLLDQLDEADGIDVENARPGRGLVSGQGQDGFEAELLQPEEVPFGSPPGYGPWPSHGG